MTPSASDPSPSSPPALDPELLLLHDAFLRSLARVLVRDAAGAEDLVQEVWARVLARAPGEGTRLRAWLAGVARNLARRERRSTARREERERRSARLDLVPSAEAILERERARRAVVEAVLDLAEPYRSTLLLRYFENEPPRAIARRCGVRVETVRTRTRRALAQVRERLDREHGGDRASWLACIAPLAWLPRAVPLEAAAALRPSLAELFAMSTPLKIGAGSIAAALFALCWMLASHAAAPAVEAPSIALVGRSEAVASTSEAKSVEREGSAAQDARAADVFDARASEIVQRDAFGALELRVLWHDRSPAAGVRLQLVPWDLPSPRFFATEVATDEQGRAFLERVPAGSLGVYPVLGGAPNVWIEAGGRARHEIVLPRGYDVEGRVVGVDGRGVEGADVWLSVEGNHADGSVVARSDADGRFSIRSVAEAHWIGARHAEFVASPLVPLFSGEGARVPVELVLGGPSGSVAGRVLDAREAPVLGALVLVEPGVEVRYEAPSAFRARTDAEGRFRVQGIAPGRREVAVRAAGHGIWRGAVEVAAGRDAQLDALLGPGVSLRGTVRDAVGAPMEGIAVQVGEYGPLQSTVRSDREGAFRLDGLEAGEIVVEADGRELGRATARFHALPGDVLEWDARFEEGLELRGRVLDERGAPLADWSVQVRGASHPGEETYCAFAVTEADGRFRVRDCPDELLRVEVRSLDAGLFPGATQSGLRPGGGEVVLRVPDRARPSVRIAGRILDAAGAPAPQARLVPRTRSYFNAPIETPRADGSFELGPYPQGEWVLDVELPGEPVLRAGPRALDAGERWDVGTLRVEAPGSLSVELAHSPALAEATRVIAIERAHRKVRTISIGARDERLVVERLAPGEYELAVVGGAAAVRLPFIVQSGAMTHLALELAPFSTRELLVRVAPDAPWAAIRLRITDAAGRCVLDEALLPDDEGACKLDACLALGRYEAAALCADGREVRAVFEVSEDAAAPIALRID